MYEARSKLMHGTAYVGKLSKRLPGLVGDAGFIEPTPERLLAFDNLVRASILYFIALQDSERRDVLENLDRSVFDPSEVARLRRMACTRISPLPGTRSQRATPGYAQDTPPGARHRSR